jgi:uncharacterized protein (TIGR00369 family)
MAAMTTKKARDQRAQLAHQLQNIFEEHVPFNKFLGVKISSLDPKHPKLRFDMRPELIGNPRRQILHGGVISSVLDVMAGVVIHVALFEQQGTQAMAADGRPEFPNIGTIDLRVDYLRPGRGAYFIASGEVVRMGKRIAVAHMQLENDTGELIATGSAAYVVG